MTDTPRRPTLSGANPSHTAHGTPRQVYEVRLTAQVTASKIVHVHADSPEEALVEARLKGRLSGRDWSPSGEPVTGPIAAKQLSVDDEP
jgi:hypothetical protein